MKERPIIFTADSVRAILDGRKTQTRRLVKLPKWMERKGGELERAWADKLWGMTPGLHVPCSEDGTQQRLYPPYEIGDRLWVRERFAHIYDVYPFGEGDPSHIEYYADGDPTRFPGEWPPETVDDPERPRWKSPFFLKRAHSRIDLEITSLRVERLRDITEADARAEGMQFHDGGGVGHSGWRHDVNYGVVCGNARSAFATAWDKINGKRATWSSSPWVWVIEFKRVRP